jgi:tetratricopeptide (TPR) repeat protein
LSLSTEIRERRVLPALGVYVGASWVVVEILDRLVERYYLSPYLTDIVFWGLYSLVPAVILLAWTHGRPGKDRVTRAEKVGVPINIIATIGLLVTVFGGKDLSATADLVTVSNELGQQERHYVPREAYRQRLATFFWSNESGDASLDWLQYGVTELLTQDLQQNPFLLVASPWDQPLQGYYSRMQTAGFPDALGLPLSLMREIAGQAGRAVFIEGVIAAGDDGPRLAARIWDTESLAPLGELVEEGPDLLAAVDRLSLGVKELLGVPPGRRGLAGDLPLVETYGESSHALQCFVEARNRVLFHNDRQRSNELLDDALAADPAFVLAWFYRGLNQWEQGDAAGAGASWTEAQKLAYRLPERDQVLLKALSYRISGEQDKLEKFLRLQIRLQDDAFSHRNLASFLMFTGRLEEAKAQFLQVIERDRGDHWSWLQLARLERASGNPEAAIDYAGRFVAARPDDLEGHLLQGDLLLAMGDFDGARAAYEQGQLVADLPVMPTLRLARLAQQQGEWKLARAQIEDARRLATSPQHASAVLAEEASLEFRLGRIGRAIGLAEAQLELNRQVMSPVEQVFSYTVPVIQYNILLDRVEQAGTVLEEARSALQPPLDQFLSFVEAILRARMGQFEAAEAAVGEGAEAIERFRADYLAFQEPLARAWIADQRGDYADAAHQFQEAIGKVQRSLVAGEMEAKLALLYGACAQMHVRAGELDVAQRVLDSGFRRDAAEPILWVARAMLHEANGSRQMALASVDFALAIWADADADYVDYREALAMRDRLTAPAP